MKTLFHVEGLSCQGCAKALETILGKDENIINVQVNLEKKEVEIESLNEIDMNACNEALDVRGFVLAK